MLDEQRFCTTTLILCFNIFVSEQTIIKKKDTDPVIIHIMNYHSEFIISSLSG